MSSELRAVLEARLQQQEAAGLHGDVRQNDGWNNRTQPVTAIPNEHVLHHPDPIIASAVSRMNGAPVDLDAPGVDLSQVILTVPSPSGNGTIQMSAAVATAMGIIRQLGPVAPAQVHAAAQPQVPAAVPQVTPEAAAEATLKESILHAFDEQTDEDLSEASRLLEQHGEDSQSFAWNAVRDNLSAADPAVQTLARATEQSPESVLEWISQTRNDVIDSTASVLSERGYDGPALLAHVYEVNPGAVERAGMAVAASGTTMPLLKAVLAALEQDPTLADRFAK